MKEECQSWSMESVHKITGKDCVEVLIQQKHLREINIYEPKKKNRNIRLLFTVCRMVNLF